MRWKLFYNLVLLRCVSYAFDLHWYRSRDASKVGSLAVKGKGEILAGGFC